MSSDKTPEMTGGCLCGGVRYRITGPSRPIIYCHCSQCRRTSGHFVAATAVKTEELIFETNEGLAWFDSSEFASRGFCTRCGSSLFWKSKNRETISIMAGTLDQSYGLKAADHIYVSDKADYYELTDDLPKIPQERK
ncbi:MAG: GFA family protein [Paracoccaceae bacterium]|nr:GFA family protein [Paracoccaceae bacterium]MDE2675417.1 GFA family protein [Paracoccaceae bacterium]